eukprot:scaffold74377_cov60-Phaeocystis_antarctica.AAC.2
MPRMSVTLDVSRLSGWLNADAPLNMPYMVVTLEVLKLSGWLNADADAAENMKRMSVTLEVSKLSGWLNADARCRESNGGHAVRGEGAGQQTGGDGVQRAAEARLQIGGSTGGSAPGTCSSCP